MEKLLPHFYNAGKPLKPAFNGVKMFSAIGVYGMKNCVGPVDVHFEEQVVTSSNAGQKNGITPSGGGTAFKRSWHIPGVDLLCSAAK